MCIRDRMEPVGDGPIDFDDAWKRYMEYIEYFMGLYVNTMNIIHYMHDKYDFEKSQMAFLDSEVKRLIAFGVAGLSVATDSLSAIKYAKVTPIRDENGLIVDYKTEGDFPKYGNDDDRVDEIAVKITEKVIEELRKHPSYRNAVHTLSCLLYTSFIRRIYFKTFKHFVSFLFIEILIKIFKKIHQLIYPHPFIQIAFIGKIRHNFFCFYPRTHSVDRDFSPGRNEKFIH